MKRSRIQGHGEEGWGSRGSRFDRGRAIAPGAIAPELSVDEFSRFAHVRCVSSESRSDPELLVSSPEERPAGREAMVDRRLDRLLDRRLGRARRGRGRQTAVPGRLDGVLRRRAFPGGDSARLHAIDA